MNERKTIYVSVDYLKNFMKDVFIQCGVTANDAEVCSDVLITSDVRGIESHGIGRLKMYVDRIRAGQIIPGAPLIIVRETPTTAVMDANHGLGMITGVKAMKTAIQKAKDYGMGAVAVRNSTHYGIAGYYAMMAIQEGMIGLSLTNARPSIAPTFGTQPMLGTNPIAFAAPTDDIPFVLDAATSIIQRGKVEIAERENHPIPEGLVIDQNGHSVTDPPAILKGLVEETMALLPLGGAGETGSGYKGYGLATMVEILCSALQTGTFLHGLSGFDSNGKDTFHRIGHFFMAINIEAFTPLDEFKKITGSILRDLRNSRKEPGRTRIYTAGEKEFENEIKIRQFGVPIIPALQDQIKILQRDLNLTHYKFDF